MGRNDRRNTELHYDAMVAFDAIQSALHDERKQCLQDRRFYSIAGAQWEGALGSQFENKPRLEVNKVAKSVDDIIREYRNNRIDVAFLKKDGSTDDTLATTCAMLYRSDEQDSCAEEAYDNAFEEAVGGGFGAWRLRACYEDEEDDENECQRIRIEPIYDADTSVYFDLDSKRQDKSDASFCFVITSMTIQEYDRKFDDDPSTWPKDSEGFEFDWLTPDVVYLAEYYRVDLVPDAVIYFQGLSGEEVWHRESELEEDDELVQMLDATGFREVRRKSLKRRKVRKWLLNGNRVLEGPDDIAGTQIPIIPVYGKRQFIDNVERCQGHVRLAKDPQRMKNMQLSKLAEISALSSVEKPIVSPEQIAGHQEMWAEDNIVNRPYLVLNPGMDAAGNALNLPMQYTKVPAIPPAMAALLQLTEMDMEQILGNPQQAEKVVSHVAGKTMEAIQMRVDARAFIYISNMGKAIRRCGQIWLAMAKELYVEEGRKMKGTAQDYKSLSQIELQKPVIDKETGLVARENDLTRASFDVVADVGPSSKSKREAALRLVTDMMAVAQDPETQQVLSNFAFMNMEGEGVEGIRKWSRMKLVRMGVEEPTPEETKMLQQEAANAKPSPNDEFILASAKKALEEAQEAAASAALKAAQVDKTKAEIIKLLSSIETDNAKAKADTIATLAGVDLDHVRVKNETAEGLHGMLTTPSPDSQSGQPPS